MIAIANPQILYRRTATRSSFFRAIAPYQLLTTNHYPNKEIFTMIGKILAAIDNSHRSEDVFHTSVSLAQARATLMLLHILSEKDPDYPILPTYAYYSALKGNDGGVLQQKFYEYEQQEAELLRNLARKAIALGVDTEYAQLSGVIGEEICEFASNWSADLILIGSRGFKGLKEMFLGSVSNYVTHHAPCSVLIVRTDSDAVSYSIDFADEEELESNSTVWDRN